jgi:WD40 repeat protein/transcriptional regulator with XRE-family HTH domain
VKKSARYREQDYVFGQQMLTLRTTLGLTQGDLAERLGISMRTVSGWEAGSNYPKAEHLKAFIALCMQRKAFPPEREEEQIRALWRAAHQKVLLDEAWLRALLGTRLPTLAGVAVERVERARDGGPARAGAALGPRLAWDEALEVSSFYNRAREIATLSEWVVRERCRVASVLGLGGIGKSALAVTLMRQVAPHFEVVLWRSLRDAPDCSALLADCLRVLAPQPLADLPASLEARLGLLLRYVREERALLVLDNLESLLEEGERAGHMRAGYEGYARLLRALAQAEHQSCLLLTSRERPGELVPLEGSRAPVRSLRLSGLDTSAGEQLLAEREVAGSLAERERLVQTYDGNPLALKIVAETITDLFDGQISPFFTGEAAIFGGISELLDEQWVRLSPLEQTVLRWLAILREPVTLDGLLAVLATPLPRVQVLEAVEALRRRSLVERGQRAGSFTLQSVVLEYATGRLINEAAGEIEAGQLSRLVEHGLELAGVRDYVRQTQTRLLVVPLLAHLRRRYQGRGEVEEHLLALLDQLRARADYAQGYGPANVLALLREERGHLRGLDLSRLAIRGASLQGVELQDATLAHALMQECVWTQSFDAIWAVAISPSGQYWAAGSRRGEVRVWREEGHTLHRVGPAHTDMVIALAFSLDERTLASGSADGSLKLWDVERRALLWTVGPQGAVLSLVFSPDGRTLASGWLDATVRLYDPRLGVPLEVLPHPSAVFALAWSPDGRLLASGDSAGTIRLWEIGQEEGSHAATCVEVLAGHSSWVRGLAFAPDGSRLASASWDGSVKLWEVGQTGSGRWLETLLEHTEQVNCLAWSPDGGTLASGGHDHTIRLWEAKSGRARVVLSGHRAEVFSLAFTPDSGRLLSGSEDGTLRVWDVQRGEQQRVIEGYTAAIFDVDWSPDGIQLASASMDGVVSLWQVAGSGGGTPRGALRGHGWTVYGVGWRPDGSVLASSGWDNAIRLWDPVSGNALEVIGDRDHPDTLFFCQAWSPDGTRLASGTYGRGVLLWEGGAGAGRWIGRELPIWIRGLAWSPNSTRLVAGGEDGRIYVWEAGGGSLLQRLAGHQGAVISVAYSPDGTLLASGGDSPDSGELCVWDARSWERLTTLQGLTGAVYSVAWHPVGKLLISGSSDGRLCWWDLPQGKCVRVREAHQGIVQALKVSPDGRRLASCGNDGAIRLWDLDSGEPQGTLRRDRPYERLDITGIRGLTQAEIATLRALGAVEDGLAAPG